MNAVVDTGIRDSPRVVFGYRGGDAHRYLWLLFCGGAAYVRGLPPEEQPNNRRGVPNDPEWVYLDDPAPTEYLGLVASLAETGNPLPVVDWLLDEDNPVPAGFRRYVATVVGRTLAAETTK